MLFWRRTICLLAIAAALALGADGQGRGGKPKPRAPNGGYKIEFKGHFTGSGTASAGSGGVLINGQVEDASGNKGAFSATAILENDRFRGTGQAMGMRVVVMGRVDPSTGAVKIGRLTCTYGTDRARFGRIVGEYTGQ